MVALKSFLRRGIHSARFRVEQESCKRQQEAAWRDLKRVGGNIAVTALEDGFALAECYRPWDGWSLSRTSIIWLAELAIRERLTNIVEFGAGYSTLVLAEYLRQIHPKTKLMSFEHQPGYALSIKTFLPDGSNVQLECVDLWQVDDTTFDQLFWVKDPVAAFKSAATPVPAEHTHETRLRNVFYHYDFETIAADTVDLVILDGPNGNGRSLAFPFLRNAIHLPGWLLVDDYQDYPFLDYCHSVFDVKPLRHFEGGGKESILVQLSGLGG